MRALLCAEAALGTEQKGYFILKSSFLMTLCRLKMQCYIFKASGASPYWEIDTLIYHTLSNVLTLCSGGWFSRSDIWMKGCSSLDVLSELLHCYCPALRDTREI